jgi:GH18 family chitinase
MSNVLFHLEAGLSQLTQARTRCSVTEANRGTLVNKVVEFVKAYDLDGVDFDWECPGEPDIPGTFCWKQGRRCKLPRLSEITESCSSRYYHRLD